MKRKEFPTYADYFLFAMNGFLVEIRYKVDWVVSNILGSERFFFSHGFQFLKHIYLEKLLAEEE
jgi:hypothetical protein